MRSRLVDAPLRASELVAAQGLVRPRLEGRADALDGGGDEREAS